MAGLDDCLGPRWEEAFRRHLRVLANQGRLGDNVVPVGPYWTADGSHHVEIDAVVLAGRERAAVAVGEAKWARRADSARLRRELERKTEALPLVKEPLVYVIGAREAVEPEVDVVAVTAADIFSTAA